MAQPADLARAAQRTPAPVAAPAPALAAPPIAGAPMDAEKTLPLPGWLVKVYFIFPVVLYIPDAIFNFYVYSDGVRPQGGGPVIQAAFMVLWGFVAIGVVGMAYLLSVLAPWHWGQGHRIQAFFCGLGVLVATGITTWNSLAYRSTNFQDFATDKWIYSLVPQLQSTGISVTMVLVAVAPPFWGLFWALVQPTQNGRSLRQIQESHAEKLLRVQQDAELKRVRAEASAKIREAQLRSMAQTAAAAREQASGLFAQMRKRQSADEPAAPDDIAAASPDDGAPAPADVAAGDASARGGNILTYPALQPVRETTGGRPVFMNSVAAAPPAPHPQPASATHPIAAQASMFTADAQRGAGFPVADVVPSGPRRPPTLADDMLALDPDAEAMTGTSGPRHAVRRPVEVSPLLRGLGELSPAYAQAVKESLAELTAGGRKRVSRNDLAARVSHKLGVDEAVARQIISRYGETQRGVRHP